MREKRDNWLTTLKAKLFPKPPPPWSLEVEEGGFSYVRTGERTKVRWADVKEIFAFKRDLFGYDLICIGFRVSDDGTWWEIDEKMGGYVGLMSVAESAFPGIRTDWFWEVAVPAFVTNLTTLWGEPKIAAIWGAKEKT